VIRKAIAIALGATLIGEVFAQGSDPIVNCILQEAAVVAPKAVDLDTASYAVIASCDTYINFKRRQLLDKYPGYQDTVRSALRGWDAELLDMARKAVATFRTSAPPNPRTPLQNAKPIPSGKRPLQLVPNVE
jgi:hypothetical protein